MKRKIVLFLIMAAAVCNAQQMESKRIQEQQSDKDYEWIETTDIDRHIFKKK